MFLKTHSSDDHFDSTLFGSGPRGARHKEWLALVVDIQAAAQQLTTQVDEISELLDKTYDEEVDDVTQVLSQEFPTNYREVIFTLSALLKRIVGF